MYICRHCGLEYKTDEAVMCTRCQAPKGKGTNFCPFCGEQVTSEKKICTNCGIEMDTYGITGSKSRIAAGLLAVFLGKYGVHNFYLGYYKKAAIQLAFIAATYIFNFISVWSVASSPFGMMDRGMMGFILSFLLGFVVAIGIRIWTFVEGILILCGKINKDGSGRRLQ